MTREPTEPTDKEPAAEHDLAPQTPAQQADHAAAGVTTLHAPATENFLKLEPTKRPKTTGERLFNIGTYGGVALLGNELTSGIIMTQAKSGIWKNQYASFKKIFTNMEGKSFIPRYIHEGRLPYVLAACIGGMLMVPPVKFLEDRKGRLVRWIDGVIHGDRARTDPDLIEAHKEMDAAPRQSWSSLGTGRAITVVSAVAADATFGWRESLTPKLLKNTFLKRFSSLDHIADETAKGFIKFFKVAPEKQVKYAENVENYTWLLTLSATLTALFYVSSKMMAASNADRREAKAHAGSPAAAPTAATVTYAYSEQLDRADLQRAPESQVSHIAHERTVSAVQQSPSV